MRSYLGEKEAKLCPELARESWRSTSSSRKDHGGGLVMVAGQEVAKTAPADFLVALRNALLGHQLLNVPGRLIANSCNGGNQSERTIYYCSYL